MNSFRLATTAVAISAATLIFATSAAQAGTVDVNISAVTNGLAPYSPVNQFLAAGNYSMTAIGQSDGGLYNGYSTGPCTSACNWLWNFVVLNNPDDPNVLHFVGLSAPQSSSLAAVNAAKAAVVWNDGAYPLPNGPFSPGTISNPIIFTVDHSGIFAFNIYEADGTYANNLGGVSLRITGANVPEPATWAMLIAGFGMIGFGMRRRRWRSVPASSVG